MTLRPKVSTLVIMALALTMAVLLAAAVLLGRSAEPHGRTVVTVRLWDEQVAAAYRKSFDEFSRLHPDIDIRVNVVAYVSYFDALRTDAAGGSADDIFWLSNAYFAGYADSDRLMDIGKVLSPNASAEWDPSVVGQAVAVTYTVTVNAPGSGTPSGNVTVSDGTESCTGTVAAGNCSIAFTSAGAKSLTATYAGNANFNGSASTPSTPHLVNKADTTITITSDTPDPSVVGQAVTVNYSVAVDSPGSGTPTGNVTVSAGPDSCVGTVATGTCTITFTSAGAKSLTASYAGDSSFNGSTSASESHLVNKANTTTTITSDSPDPSVVGQAVTVNYSVTVNTPGSGTPRMPSTPPHAITSGNTTGREIGRAHV